MLTVIIIISIALIIFGCRKASKTYDDEGWITLVIICGFVTFIASVFWGIAAYTVVSTAWMDDKIAIYEARNVEINDALAETIKGYQGYEKETYAQLKLENATVAINAFPELKTQPLVQEQIVTYKENVTKIAELKEEKINARSSLWLLNFCIWGLSDDNN